ncbi:homoserine kinase [Erythrobacteraceae bacterium WH01K]|nr:homoserine kinase [Erythrobacteraceae bacterium WH01K]
MAVYTHLSAEDLSDLIGQYDVGELVSAKGIAEGVSNSNWLIETTGGEAGSRFILTMYERHIDLADLPFFLDLLDHLAARGCPVPRTIHDRSGAASRKIGGKTVALIEFLPGLSVDAPTPAQARSAGEALAGMHLASRDYAGRRANTLGPAGVAALFDSCEGRLGEIDPALPALVADHVPKVAGNWPDTLPQGIAHTDLFPDNVLVEGDRVNAMIDFYFACHETLAYDLATTHLAWSFERGTGQFRPDVGRALVEGYETVRPLSDEERAALPFLAKAAALRFIATRSYDWLFTPADALVTRKDPMEFVQRLLFYDEAGPKAFA